MLSGQCACGIVEFEVNGPLITMYYCHCSACRRTTGSSFATNSAVHREHFKIISGESNLSSFNMKPEQELRFCKTCSSRICMSHTAYNNYIFIPAGAYNEDPKTEIEAHFNLESKAPWTEIHDQIPQFQVGHSKYLG
jgi:hypothetical protein